MSPQEPNGAPREQHWSLASLGLRPLADLRPASLVVLHRALDGDDPGIEINIGPPEGEQLALADLRQDGEPSSGRLRSQELGLDHDGGLQGC